MNEIEHEGKTYILKSNVENIIKERVAKVATRASEAEQRATDFESQLKASQKKQANVDVLTNQISELKTQLETSSNKFNRFQSISKLGITDGEIIDLIEWSFDKSMQGKDAKDQQDLSEWLSHNIENIEEAPAAIRPHLKAIQSTEPPTGAEASEQASEAAQNAQITHEASDASQMQQLQQMQQQMTPPAVNKGAIKSPDSKNIMQRAMTDQNFYNQNADAVRQAYFAQFKG